MVARGKRRPTQKNTGLRPATRCIWYVLATIAGEATLIVDVDEADTTMKLNQYYWNGLMRERMLLTSGFFEARLDRHINLPTLTKPDRDAIRAALDARGFEGVSIPNYQDTIDFSHVDFPNSTWFPRVSCSEDKQVSLAPDSMADPMSSPQSYSVGMCRLIELNSAVPISATTRIS